MLGKSKRKFLLKVVILFLLINDAPIHCIPNLVISRGVDHGMSYSYKTNFNSLLGYCLRFAEKMFGIDVVLVGGIVD